MLSYQHGFHAGNFADVLKHCILVRTLQYLIQKDKPLFYLDTHAAAGAYTLNSDMARKTGEYKNGIGKLWGRDDLPPALADYVRWVRTFNGAGSLYRYPGSPWFASQLLRNNDRLALCELHVNEYSALKHNMAGDRRIRVLREDGFKSALALLPPRERRGLVLIDPPYEIKQDYQLVVQTLSKAYRRFAHGVYALWYPVVDRHRIDAMEAALRASGMRDIQLFELGAQADSSAPGMTASGMILINPPWSLREEMQSVLPYLAKLLGNQGHYRIEELLAE
ncbi:23S rRNA (adenine(2030)-N(6))-methyltransferase RlmJ [Methylomarinum vadi]|uniref:23S rRNA (adenine(2030)-N(6))-methyltransferase RlmJ n=1 Tax=Methylomarinum vadi TaxID=438855 RepID=UPI0004DFCDA0|nr:23S rRNA (adenine(2030)-N(6))-methyltransferase RlmJ [Methylomarinum vadi]